MASRDINQCTLWMRKKWGELRAMCARIGLDVRLSCTTRSCDEHGALWAQGRRTLDFVNHARAKVGLPSITAAQNKRKVTWTLNSKHVLSDNRPLSEAFDVYLQKDNLAIWDLKADVNEDNRSDYDQIITIARSIGLVCGADFSNPDYSHFECPSNKIIYGV